jgi:hypothetical protein
MRLKTFAHFLDKISTIFFMSEQKERESQGSARLLAISKMLEGAVSYDKIVEILDHSSPRGHGLSSKLPMDRPCVKSTPDLLSIKASLGYGITPKPSLPYTETPGI